MRNTGITVMTAINTGEGISGRKELTGATTTTVEGGTRTGMMTTDVMSGVMIAMNTAAATVVTNRKTGTPGNKTGTANPYILLDLN